MIAAARACGCSRRFSNGARSSRRLTNNSASPTARASPAAAGDSFHNAHLLVLAAELGDISRDFASSTARARAQDALFQQRHRCTALSPPRTRNGSFLSLFPATPRVC